MPQQCPEPLHVQSVRITYLLPEFDSLFSRLLRGLFLGVFHALEFALVEAREVLLAGIKIKADLFNGRSGLPFLRGRWSCLFDSRLGEHGCWLEWLASSLAVMRSSSSSSSPVNFPPTQDPCLTNRCWNTVQSDRTPPGRLVGPP